MNNRKDDERIGIIETHVEYIKKGIDKIDTSVDKLVLQSNSNKWRIRGAFVWLAGLTAGLTFFVRLMINGFK